MEINYQNQRLRSKRTREVWVRMATDYNGGMTVEEIRRRYKKADGSMYSRAYIYQIFQKLVKGGEKA